MSSRNADYVIVCFFQLYQIGIRCLAATVGVVNHVLIELYQIGIRCLAATFDNRKTRNSTLYQIGIRCLAATIYILQ